MTPWWSSAPSSAPNWWSSAPFSASPWWDPALPAPCGGLQFHQLHCGGHLLCPGHLLRLPYPGQLLYLPRPGHLLRPVLATCPALRCPVHLPCPALVTCSVWSRGPLPLQDPSRIEFVPLFYLLWNFLWSLFFYSVKNFELPLWLMHLDRLIPREKEHPMQLE